MKFYRFLIAALALIVFAFPARAAEPRPLTLAPVPEVPTTQAEIFIPLTNYLKKALNRPVRLVFTESYDDLLDQFGKGKIDIVFGGPYTLSLARERYGARVLAGRKIDGKSDYQSYLFVREESGITDLTQLRGKRFAFTDPFSTSGYLIPRIVMAEAGIVDPNTFFSEIKFKRNYGDVIESVLMGEVDAAAVASFQFDGFGLRNRSLRVIKQSDRVTLGPVFANTGTLSDAEMEKIKQVFLAIGKTSETESLAKILYMSEFMEVAEDAYRWVDDYRKRLASLPPVWPIPEGWLLPDIPTSPLSTGLPTKTVAIISIVLTLLLLSLLFYLRSILPPAETGSMVEGVGSSVVLCLPNADSLRCFHDGEPDLFPYQAGTGSES